MKKRECYIQSVALFLFLVDSKYDKYLNSLKRMAIPVVVSCPPRYWGLGNSQLWLDEPVVDWLTTCSNEFLKRKFWFIRCVPIWLFALWRLKIYSLGIIEILLYSSNIRKLFSSFILHIPLFIGVPEWTNEGSVSFSHPICIVLKKVDWLDLKILS